MSDFMFPRPWPGGPKRRSILTSGDTSATRGHGEDARSLEDFWRREQANATYPVSRAVAHVDASIASSSQFAVLVVRMRSRVPAMSSTTLCLVCIPL